MKPHSRVGTADIKQALQFTDALEEICRSLFQSHWYLTVTYSIRMKISTNDRIEELVGKVKGYVADEEGWKLAKKSVS